MREKSKLDQHPLDRFISVFGLRRFCLPASFVAASIGVYLSIHFESWQWFSRFGAIIAVFGLLLTMSPIFVRGLYKSHSQCFSFADMDKDGATVTTTEEDRKIGSRVATGVIVAILGTLSNAFGDLVGKIVSVLC
jgi:hypothetical protein